MYGKGLRLYKREKLRSVKAIDRLFAVRPPKGESVTDDFGNVTVRLAYPLRMVCGTNPGREGADTQFLVSVPKRKLRRAVDRVKMRRRIREAYRHVRGPIESLAPTETKTDIAFIYVADKLVDYERVLRAMQRLLVPETDTTPDTSR